MSDEKKTDDTYVRKFGFRRFSGVRENRINRVITVAWFNLIESIKQSGLTKLLLIFMFFSLLIQDALLIVLSTFLPFGIIGDITITELFRGAYIDSVLGMVSLTNRITTPLTASMSFFTSFTSVTTSFIWLLLLVRIGGGLIADDRLYRTTEMYLSRISRIEYLIGKLGSLVIFSCIIVVLPALIQFFLLGAGLQIDLLFHLDLLFWAFGFTFTAAVILSFFVLSISSLTERRNVATLASFILALSLSILPTAIGGAFATGTAFLALDFVGCIAVSALVILGFDSILVNFQTVDLFDNAGFEAYMSFASTLVVVLICGVIMVNFMYREGS
ncbi:MAG: conserved membrane protein of unknown function [Candidatus Thorarchaeota archaeon]|nr:MAG: conserved membrane protein of unknown function [Candidatus Thorarchaeota archaeon]